MSGRRASLSILVLAFVARGAAAWETKDHRTVVTLAIEHSSPALASFLRANLDDVMRGSVDPDLNFMDTENHTYHVDDGTRKNPDHVAYLASTLTTMMRNGAPREKVAYWFGALSHYVSDIDEPLHTSDRDKRENWYHPLFEALGRGVESHSQVLGFKLDFKLGKALSGWRFNDDGRRGEIDDVRAWQLANARWAYRYYDEIGGIYARKGARDADRLSEIFRTCYAEGVSDVIDAWDHVFRSADGDLAALPAASDVFLLEVDEKGRIHGVEGRLGEDGLRVAIRRYVADRARSMGDSVPSAYVEIDDRCDGAMVKRLERICQEAGVSRFSAISMRKGPATSRFYRWLKMHAESLAAR